MSGKVRLTKWTFRRLRTEPVEGGLADASLAAAAASTPTWVFGVAIGSLLLLVAALSVGIAELASAMDANRPAAPPPSPPVQQPYNADLADYYCSNDCLGCGQTGGCTASYGADGNPDTEHDSRAFQSNGVCDDGGHGSEYSFCDIGSDCADCGIRPMPPPPPDYPSLLPGMR